MSDRRAHYLPPMSFYALDRACVTINDSLPGFGCYLVGSSLERRDYRDVDVRFIMGDEDYDKLFGREDAFWSLLCISISTWLSKESGLPVDFQIQRQTQANAKHNGFRNALGIVKGYYPGELPSYIVDSPKDDNK